MAALNPLERTPPGGQPTQAAQLKMRVAELVASDAQFRDATPLTEITEAKKRLGLGLAQIVGLTMEAYADRAALAQRASQLVTDPQTGRKTRQLMKAFEAITYRELWSRATALATVWQHRAAERLNADEFLCILAFAGIDYATVDFAAIRNGAIVVPLQTKAPISHLLNIVKEIEPRWIAVSLECLSIAVELVTQGHRPAGMLVFDYDAEVDDQREIFEAAKAKLTAAGIPDFLQTLQMMCARGAQLPATPVYAAADTDNRLCTIYYTSGSTGLPKGAMYPERMVKPSWRAPTPTPVIYVHYMPMNHSFGRSGVFATLGNGGICYFTAKSDLSTLFEDFGLVRPTQLALVPRICEMIYQLYQVEVERRTARATDLAALKQEMLLEIRQNALGVRLLSCGFGSAPLAAELREFIEKCLGFPLTDHYGCTELSGVTHNSRVVRPTIIDYKLDDVPELGYFKTDKPYPRGELRVKSHSLMLGYYKRPEITAQMFDDEGYYKTGDIMAEVGTDQLTYVDRRNNVLKLAQGEFVAISHLEALYTNGHPAIKQVFLYGSSERSYLLGVIVPNLETLTQMGVAGDAKATKQVLREAIQETARLEQLNAYEVPRDFMIEHEPFSVENGLLTGIGKYQRPAFKARYGLPLEDLYSEIADGQASELKRLRSEGREGPILETVARVVKAILGIEDVDSSQRQNFSELGGDSLSALSCSMLLEDIYEFEVPVSVINNPAGDLQQLARYIERARDTSLQRATFATVHSRGAKEIRASDLTLDKFLDLQTLERAQKLAAPRTAIRTVLLTGANGYLGRFLCLEWLERMSATDGSVICIARAQDADAARQRVADVFDGIDSRLTSHFKRLAAKHLQVLAGDLSEPFLGLGHTDWLRLAETVDLIVHPAALVNHVLPYSQLFGPNVVGTAELIRLAITHRLKPINNVSTVAAAMRDHDAPLDEDADVRVATPVRNVDAERYANGYANSKWAGEVLLRDAHDRFGLPVSVFRSDMILAHSGYSGQINVPDMFTRWLFSIVVTGLAPRSFYREAIGVKPHYDGLPVDFTAAAIAVLGAEALTGYRTYHVVNPHDDAISLDTFVDWAIEAGHPIQRIDDYADWLSRFETALRALPEKQRQQSSLPLIHQMRSPMQSTAGAHVSAQRFHDDIRKHAIGRDGDIPHLSAEFISKYLDDMRVLRLI